MAAEPGQGTTYPPLGHWSLRSRCFQLGLDPDLFFEDLVPQVCRDACASCPVRAECLGYAMENQPHGFWGGCTARERRRKRLAGKAVVVRVEPVRQACPHCGRLGLAGAVQCHFCGARWPAMT